MYTSLIIICLLILTFYHINDQSENNSKCHNDNASGQTLFICFFNQTYLFICFNYRGGAAAQGQVDRQICFNYLYRKYVFYSQSIFISLTKLFSKLRRNKLYIED